MIRIDRGVFIVWIVLRFGLDELLLSGFKQPWLKVVSRVLTVGRNLRAPRGERLRLALESLGPVFVKFGQVLSTRRDLLPEDISDELAKLQDQGLFPLVDDKDRRQRHGTNQNGCRNKISCAHQFVPPVAVDLFSSFSGR